MNVVCSCEDDTYVFCFVFLFFIIPFVTFKIFWIGTSIIYFVNVEWMLNKDLKSEVTQHSEWVRICSPKILISNFSLLTNNILPE